MNSIHHLNSLFVVCESHRRFLSHQSTETNAMAHSRGLEISISYQSCILIRQIHLKSTINLRPVAISIVDVTIFITDTKKIKIITLFLQIFLYRMRIDSENTTNGYRIIFFFVFSYFVFFLYVNSSFFISLLLPLAVTHRLVYITFFLGSTQIEF